MIRNRRFCVAVATFGLLAGLTLSPSALQAQRKQPFPNRPPDVEGVEEQTFDGLSIPRDREASGIIEAAKEYVKKNDWDTVARSLQFLLEKPEDSFFEVKRKRDNKEYTTRISIRIEANRLIGELPKEGLEIYRQKYGQRAMQMLQEGTDKNDPNIISMVALRYRHTEAGTKAIHLLGNYFLDRGNYQMASGKFQELLELLEHEKPEVKKEIAPKVFFKAALAYQRFGDRAMAEKLWKQVIDLTGDKGLTYGTQTFTVEQLRKEFERNAQVGAMTIASWMMMRGDPSRTAQSVGGVPFLEARWQQSMFVPNKDREKDDDPSAKSWLKEADWVQEKVKNSIDLIERGTSQKRALMPGFFPVAAANRVVFRTYDGVYAFFIRDDAGLGAKAGEIAWAQHTDGSLHAMGSDQGGNRGQFEAWWSNYAGVNGIPAMPGIVFENSAVGTLSHDNQLVYYVDDLAVPPHPQMTMWGFQGQASPFGAFTDKVLFSSLRAVDLETGRLTWEIGGRKQGSKFPVIQNPNMARAVPVGPDGKPIAKPKEEPVKPVVPPKDLPQKPDFVNAGDELLDSFFLGPPLPIGGKLYVLVEYNGEIQLCCINSKNMQKCKVATTDDTAPSRDGPELVWRQPLGTANFKLMQDTLRRIQPCHLAYNDGILICPTNAGAIVAVNLLTQSLAWAYSYRTGASPDAAMGGGGPPGMGMGRGGRFRGDYGMPVNLSAERWFPAPPAIVNGRVIFTAYDSGHLQCLSLRDGELLWSVNRGQNDLYMAGVYQNKVIVVGKTSIRALDVMDGSKIVWEKPIGMPSGQGVAAGGKYYLPCRSGLDTPDPQILEINIDTGEMHATKSRKKEIPGNLIFFDGDVISQNIWSVSAYPQLKVKKAEMKARLAKNPKDPAGLTDSGELHLDDGELLLAVADFKAALEYQPGPDIRARARLKLYDTLTELLKDRFADGEQFLDVYKDLCLNEVTGDELNRRHSNYLCLLGKGRESQGRLVEAFDAYMDFGRINQSKEMVPSIDDPTTLARPDVWARGRIVAMMTKAKPEDKKPLEERIRKQWETVKATNKIDEVRSFVGVFGSMFAAGQEARLNLAERLMHGASDEDLREAKLHLMVLSGQSENQTLAAQATEALARLMIQQKILPDALYHYRRLGNEFRNVKLRDGKTGGDIYNEVITDKRFLEYLEPARQTWAPGEMRGEQVNTTSHAMAQYAGFSFVPEGELLPIFDRYRLVMDTQSPSANGQWQLRFIERATGKEVQRHASLFPNPYLLNVVQGPNLSHNSHNSMMRFAQVRGHILVITLQHMVYAFDMSDQKKLWEYNLFGKGNTIQGLQQAITNADGTMQLVYYGGTKLRLGQLGIVESSYVCLPTRDGLVALDPIKGAVLWKKDVPTGSFLFGDADHVFIVEANESGSPSKAMAIRAADGVTVNVPEFANLFHPSRRLKIIGRHILAFDEDSNGKALRLYDPLTGKDVWRETFPAGSKPARSVDANLAAVVEPDGTVTVFDLIARKAAIKVKGPDDRVQAEHFTSADELLVLADREHYYLILNKPPEAGMQVMPYVINGIRSVRVNGPLYAFDKNSGSLDWRCDYLTNQFMVLEQFEDLPICIFAAYANKFNRNGMEQQQAKVEAYDKKTGKTILDRQIPATAQFYAMTANARAGEIELLRYDLKIRFAQKNAEKAGADVKEGPVPAPIGPGGLAPPPPMIRGAIRLMPAQKIQIQAQTIPAAPPKVAPAIPPPPPKDKPKD
jgi:outer membrane protein assembly factor BamB/tetratricopeptide (TPR) repeat protein